jgi:hypothetical protein
MTLQTPSDPRMIAALAPFGLDGRRMRTRRPCATSAASRIPCDGHGMAEYSEPAHSRAPRRKVYASAKFRVTDGSTGMPGPVVVDIVTFFR